MMAALVMVSSVGALTGIILTGPRVYYSMAQDGLAPRWLGHIHPVHRTPSHAIVAQARCKALEVGLPLRDAGEVRLTVHAGGGVGLDHVQQRDAGPKLERQPSDRAEDVLR